MKPKTASTANTMNLNIFLMMKNIRTIPNTSVSMVDKVDENILTEQLKS